MLHPRSDALWIDSDRVRTITAPIAYQLARSATLHVTVAELSAISSGPALTLSGGDQHLDLFARGLVAVRGTCSGSRVFVVIDPADHPAATDDDFIALAKPLIEAAFAERRTAASTSDRPSDFRDLSEPGGVGPVVILGLHPYEREILRAGRAEWRNDDGTDLLIIDADGHAEWRLRWGHIVQTRKPASDGQAWEVVVSDRPVTGTTTKTR
jgi:hypothetical protein